MDRSIAYLTAMQITNFFLADGRPTQQECDQMAEGITGERAVPAVVQGGSSYTVIAGDYVIQFRVGSATLDLEFLGHVEKAYAGFMPWHTDSGNFGGLHVYTMSNVGGVSLYLARQSLHRNDCYLLQQTVTDFARLFSSAWRKTPEAMPLPDRQSLYSKYRSQLSQLSAGLPERFRLVLDQLIPRLPYLLGADWPLVPNHVDLVENNIHVYRDTGKLTGICDWAGTEISPFGMSLGAVENILGIPTVNESSGRNGHVYHANHQELRDLFYDELYSALGHVSDDHKKRIEDARLIGLFLTNGWRYDTAGNQLPAGEDEHGLQHLDAVLRATYDGF
ncbi:hypothetical protein FRC10_005043 [Ceratobasidium sp. 414]|nr:hypothetical protein FRC10_005043 [Ceratobasidium sp. 414]